MDRKWLVSRTNPEYVDYVSRVSSVSRPFAQVLINRGIKTPDQLDAFLNPRRALLSDPMDLPNLADALERIRTARDCGERVLVHGDYDADGTTAAAIMVEGLRHLGIESHYFIPNRDTHGYGFGARGIEYARQIGASLIITVDCGISSFEACAASKNLDIDVIITDHHEPVRRLAGEYPLSPDETSFVIPEAVAIVNPRLMTGASVLKDLSGAGVAFSVVRALLGTDSDDIVPFFDLAALGTAADVVPVFGDNRIMIKEGLRLIHAGQRPGLRALKEVSGIRSDSLRMASLYYAMIPRINAAGRIADATDVVTLMTTRSWPEAERIALQLNQLNLQRQQIEESVHQDALQNLQRIDVDRCGVIVLASEGWHQGVLGIVASRIAETYHKPTFILTIDHGVAKGSARSIPAFDICRGLSECRDLLIRFGGHRQAAGLSLSSDMIGDFTRTISEIARKTLSEDDFAPALCLDATMTIADVTMELTGEIARLEPFGFKNEEPLFGAKHLEVVEPRVVGNNHVKMHLRQHGRRLNAIGFDLGGEVESLSRPSRIDAAFCPMINEWNGSRYLQLNLKAFRPSLEPS
jgi:single-stranded-DNA-specific exonuclease